MIEHPLDAIEVFDIVAVPPVVDDGADLLLALETAQLSRDAVRQPASSAKARQDAVGLVELECRYRLGESPRPKTWRRQQRVKGDR